MPRSGCNFSISSSRGSLYTRKVCSHSPGSPSAHVVIELQRSSGGLAVSQRWSSCHTPSPGKIGDWIHSRAEPQSVMKSGPHDLYFGRLNGYARVCPKGEHTSRMCLIQPPLASRRTLQMVARGLKDCCSVPSDNQPVCRAGLWSLRDAQSITTGLFLSLESGRQDGLPQNDNIPTLAQL